MIRKMFSTVIAIIISTICLLCWSSSAAYIPPDTPQYSYTKYCSSELTISGTTATCTSNATGYVNETTKIIFNQTLQKQNSSGSWSDVTSASWTKTVYYYKGSATNTKSSLASGTYRLKTVFTVYAGSSYETITKYSSEKVI